MRLPRSWAGIAAVAVAIPVGVLVMRTFLVGVVDLLGSPVSVPVWLVLVAGWLVIKLTASRFLDRTDKKRYDSV